MFHVHSKSQESYATSHHQQDNVKHDNVNTAVEAVEAGETEALSPDKSLVSSSRADDSPTGQRNLNTSRQSQQHFKSASSFLVSLRAATLLLPLYGLHYLVIVYRPDVE